MNKKTVAKLIRKTVAILSGILGVLLVVYSIYVLWDSYYINKKAFSSQDLQQYKPTIDEEDHAIGFEELQALNSDTIGWVTVFDTNIDYPVMKSVDDNDYINIDIYGNFSLSGSIYLSYKNSTDLGDSYNIIYGHHMDSGAMFGDIDKFTSKDFFDSHMSGVLITPTQVYDIAIFACVETNAYEDMIYDVTSRNIVGLDGLAEYIRNHAILMKDFDINSNDKLLVLSTCSDYTTNGRLTLFSKLTPRTSPYIPEETEIESTSVPEVTGHQDPYKGASWSLISLICVFFTLYLVLPIHCIKEKIRLVRKGIPMSKAKLLTSLILENILALASIILFIILESFKAPMVLINGTTILFVVILGVSIVIDIFLVKTTDHS